MRNWYSIALDSFLPLPFLPNPTSTISVPAMHLLIGFSLKRKHNILLPASDLFHFVLWSQGAPVFLSDSKAIIIDATLKLYISAFSKVCLEFQQVRNEVKYMENC